MAGVLDSVIMANNFLVYCLSFITPFFKVPQILKIWREKSAAGMTKSLIYIDYYSTFLGVAYPISQNHPLSAIISTLFWPLQNLIIISLFWYYQKTSKLEILMVGSYFIAFGMYLFSGLVSDTEWTAIISFNIALKLPNLVPQIYTNYISKSTGALNILTYGIITTVCFTKLLTFSLEIGDLKQTVFYIITSSLSFTIFVQILVYGQQKKEPPKPVELEKVV